MVTTWSTRLMQAKQLRPPFWFRRGALEQVLNHRHGVSVLSAFQKDEAIAVYASVGPQSWGCTLWSTNLCVLKAQSAKEAKANPEAPDGVAWTVRLPTSTEGSTPARSEAGGWRGMAGLGAVHFHSCVSFRKDGSETRRKTTAKSQHEATGASFRVVAGKPKGLGKGCGDPGRRMRGWLPQSGDSATWFSIPNSSLDALQVFQKTRIFLSEGYWAEHTSVPMSQCPESPGLLHYPFHVS